MTLLTYQVFKTVVDMGVISNIVAGLVGSSIGEAVLGAWGPQVAGMAIIPSIIGAVILVDRKSVV